MGFKLQERAAFSIDLSKLLVTRATNTLFLYRIETARFNKLENHYTGTYKDRPIKRELDNTRGIIEYKPLSFAYSSRARLIISVNSNYLLDNHAVGNKNFITLSNVSRYLEH